MWRSDDPGNPAGVAFIVFAKRTQAMTDGNDFTKRTQDATAGGALGRAAAAAVELFQFKEVIHEITDRLAAFMHYT